MPHFINKTERRPNVGKLKKKKRTWMQGYLTLQNCVRGCGLFIIEEINTLTRNPRVVIVEHSIILLAGKT